MDYSKELLLFVATTITGVGAATISTNIQKGVILLLIGACVFIARGFYKKYIGQ